MFATFLLTDKNNDLLNFLFNYFKTTIMKNLKLKSIVLGFMAMLMVSVMMTSCEQTELEDIGVETPIENTEQAALEADIPEFFLPHGYEDKMSEEAIGNYISTLDTEGFEKLVLHRKVIYYFVSLDKIDVLIDNATYGDIFGANTVMNYLSSEESRLFESFNVESLATLRGCTEWQDYGNPYQVITSSGFPLNWPICKRFQQQRRTCTRWWNPNLTYTSYRAKFLGYC